MDEEYKGSIKEQVAKVIESYLTETDTSDIVENADYHGRILASCLEPYLTKGQL